MMTNQDLKKTTSTGHDLSEAEYLDRHFESMRPEYTQMLHSVGIQAGWRVLDAGAGSGGFLPLIDQQVGKTGRIDALDLAPENVEILEKRVGSGELVSQAEAKLGSVTQMPYEDNRFDLVWNANVSQYLTDDELTAMLSEAYRVTKPGGLVATKEFDMTSTRQWAPLDPTLLWHLLEATRNIPQVAGALRSIDLSRWYRKAGLEIVSIKTFSGERWQPLRPVERAYLSEIGAVLAGLAADFSLPEAELIHWRRLTDPTAADYLLDDPDFCWRESNVVIIGRKPA